MITKKKWDMKTREIIEILKMYIENKHDYLSILNLKLIELINYTKELDPYMHYDGKSIKIKEDLKKNRILDDIELLKKIWEIYLLSNRLYSWKNILEVNNQNKVLKTIEIFFNKNIEIFKML